MGNAEEEEEEEKEEEGESDGESEDEEEDEEEGVGSSSRSSRSSRSGTWFKGYTYVYMGEEGGWVSRYEDGCIIYPCTHSFSLLA